MESVPFPQSFHERVLLLLNLVERADGLAQMVPGSDRPSHPDLREMDHGRVQEVSTVAEGCRIEKGRRLFREISSRPFEPRLKDEQVLGEGHQLPFFGEYLPIFGEGEALGEGGRVLRK